MLIGDTRGNLVTATNPGAVALLDDTVDAYLGFRNDTGDRLKATLVADPDLVLGHCLRGYFMMMFGQRALVPRAARSLAAAQAAMHGVGTTGREHAHVGALAAWIGGDFTGATARWTAIAAEHPRDVLALKLAQEGYFWVGESARMHDVAAHARRAWDADVPGYGFVLGCHAFGLEEVGDYRAAERAGRQAIERNPADIWAAHAVAHACEMTGRPWDGVALTNRLERHWHECNSFAYHLYWHRCLFLLELGMRDRVLELYDREVRPQSTDDLFDIANGVSLLWRLEQEGVDVGDRWQELADWAQTHVDDHLLPFGDVHYLMALIAAGRDAEAERALASLNRFALDSSESAAAAAREPGLTLAAAVAAYRHGEHDRALALLLSVRARIRRIGGSHAQRDLFAQMTIDSALLSGDRDTAASLLVERLEQRPGNAWARRRQARLLHQFGPPVRAPQAHMVEV